MNSKINKKKIVFFIEALEGGGAERVTSILASQFYQVNYDVTLIVLNKSDKEYFLDSGVKKIYIGDINSSSKLIRIIKRMLKVNKILKKSKSEIIISLAMPTSNITLLPALISNSRKVILSERNDPHNYPSSNFAKKVRNICYKLADALVFQTNDAKNYFSKSIQRKGIIIPNPINEMLPEPYQGIREKKIVNFCRLDTQKNLPMLIDAFAMFSKDFPEFELIIYGRGPLEEELRKYAKSKNLGENKIQIKDYQENIHDTILSYSLFVSSSDYEGISNSMLESLAIGLPTICTDCPVGGARMVIKPYHNGLLVPVGDVESLYLAMKEVISNKELSQKISANAIKIREELSKEVIFKQWVSLVNKLA